MKDNDDRLENEERAPKNDNVPPLGATEEVSGRYYEKVKNSGKLVFLNDQVGDEEAKQIAKALMDDPNTKVEILWLANNSIKDEGAAALAEALKSNTTLQQIFLANNAIGPEGATALGES